MKRLIVLGIFILLNLNFVFALDHLVISEVLVDPINSENGGEAIEIYNPTSEDISLCGFTIKTETSEKDVTLPCNEEIKSKSYFLITDTGWGESKDSDDYPDFDYAEPMSLKNTNSGLALVKNGSMVDSVGWGNVLDENLFEGTPYDSIGEGLSLQRINVSEDSNDNSIDFLFSSPNLHNAEYEEDIKDSDIEINITVKNNAPLIKGIFVNDDLASEEGIQIIPSPGELKKFVVNVSSYDLDGLDDLIEVKANIDKPSGEKAEFYLADFVCNGINNVYSGDLSLNFFESPGLYNLTIFVKDLSGEVVKDSILFEYESLISVKTDIDYFGLDGLSVGGKYNIEGDLDMVTDSNPTLQNTGNVEIDLGFNGYDLTNGKHSIPISNVYYSFANNFSSEGLTAFSKDLFVNEVGLAPGALSLQSLALTFEIPENVSKGNYLGGISVVGVAK